MDRPTYREVARAESERGEVVLRERCDAAGGVPALELRANGVFVMDTVEVGSELALATAALDLLDDPRHVLVGGLGLGFTLRAVLDDRRVEACTVVEIEPALVGWMRDGTVPHGPALLADDRVRVVEADLAVAVAEAPEGSVDLMLLDVDNGPGYLVHETNAELYRTGFLTRTRALLRPGGAVAVWSAAAAPELEASLGEAYGGAEAHRHPVTLQGRAEDYWLYVARRDG